MESELASIEERIATVGTDYADLNQEQQSGILSQLNQWKLSLENTRRQMAEIPPEILRAPISVGNGIVHPSSFPVKKTR